MYCRILKKQKCQITKNYSDNHPVLDVVGENSTLDYIIAHSTGKIIKIQDGVANMKGSTGTIAYGKHLHFEVWKDNRKIKTTSI